MLTLTLTTLMTTLTLNNAMMSAMMLRVSTMSNRVDVVTTLPSATTMIMGYPVPVMSVTAIPSPGSPRFRGSGKPPILGVLGGVGKTPDFGVLAGSVSKRARGPGRAPGRAGALLGPRAALSTRNPGSAISAMFRTGRPPARAPGETPGILGVKKGQKNGRFLAPAAKTMGGVGGLRPLT